MHHVCKGTCGGESDEAGVCQAEGCPKHGEQLADCDCRDGSHEMSKDSDPCDQA